MKAPRIAAHYLGAVLAANPMAAPNPVPANGSGMPASPAIKTITDFEFTA